VYTVTASQAAAIGYRGWIPADESHVVLYAKSEHVSYADLDLSKPADVALMRDRLNAAALKVCKEIGWKYIVSMPKTRTCAREATERALANLRRQRDAKGLGQIARTN
jgi:UrcA family protein